MNLNTKVKEKHSYISFVSNDYLGLSHHPAVILAGVEGVIKYGAGACAAPSIGGYLDIHARLEKEIAAFTGQEDALIFSSGFGANSGTLRALLGKNDLALIDSFVHTSVLDGLQSTNIKNIGHNNLEYLELVLKRERRNYKTKMVIVDGVYSQDGDISLLPDIQLLCEKYGAVLYVDDAHGIGLFGETGKGIVEHYNMLGKVDILTGTFSKAFGGIGGFVCTSKKIIQYLRYYANTTVYSAAITPQVTFSIRKALELVKSSRSFKDKLWDNIRYLRTRLTEEKFNIGCSVSPIFPIKINEDSKVRRATSMLLDKGIYVSGIMYPAVRRKDARLRVSVTASHTKEQLEEFVRALISIDNQLLIR
ncbi:MAG: aminotransferase class I/II-fold pyridoxal phosphate-dependent enzyme [Tannerellaceae bacterium]|nr:aminotransferase class I/II-fold pyridoxal phosphate-dependent enzyme [Tannerellaceae bacterium]MCD8264557.1 aminotransferase class I/II-fold pyridoxal phosphate-dependent enzyme [Tannerellaceae bacterium]